MAIKFKEIWKDRIKHIDIDIRKAIKARNWTEKAKLEAEKVELEKRLRG